MVMHDAGLRGLAFDKATGQPLLATDGRPALFERTDEDFIAAMLAELKTPKGRKELSLHVVNAGASAPGLELYQPVHRTFYMVILEAFCHIFGEPRLDPDKIDSAGLVVRRVLPSGAREAWLRKDGQVIGWRSLDDVRIGWDDDPDLARRPEPYPAGHPVINEHLRAALGAPEAYEEAVSCLFVAPPDVCAANGRTILHGLVPLSGADPLPTSAPRPRYEADEIEAQLGPWFGANAKAPSLEGIADKRFTSERWRDEAADLGEKPARNLDHFVDMLRRMVSIFDAFEDKPMLAALNRVSLEYDEGAKMTRQVKMGDTLFQAVNTFIHGKPGTSFVLPSRWPKLTQDQAQTIARAASPASDKRIQAVVPRSPRFGEPNVKYEVRAFIRVKRDDGCPPKLVWTNLPSQPFTLAPWYQNGKLPPVEVVLPPVKSDNVKSFLPNVAFRVPKNIFDLLSKNSPKDFLDSKAKEGSDTGVDWICGFNIPIITLCAFIVLSIFLVLFNFVFWWIAFVKICIPVPRALLKGK